MAEKKNFVLRLDIETFKEIEKWSADEFRSVNGQIEYLLHQALKQHKRTSKTKAIDKKSKS